MNGGWAGGEGKKTEMQSGATDADNDDDDNNTLIGERCVQLTSMVRRIREGSSLFCGSGGGGVPDY